MPRRTNAVPKYRLHKLTGQAVVTISSAGGGRRDVYLGSHGSAESKAEYARIVAELQTAPAAGLVVGPRPPAPSINEVLVAFMGHADCHYRGPEGEVTRELTEYRQAVKLVRGLYGHTPAKDFGPLALKAVRQQMVAAGLCRGLVNRRVGRVKRMFKWAASEELVPAAVFQSLATVAGLRAGKAETPEAPPVTPVADEVVAATLPHLLPTVRAMVEVQRLTGMRPGEVCRLRPCDVDTSGAVWVYRPKQHKGAWRDKGRMVAIGPKAQAVLKPFWPADPAAHVFSPARAVQAFHAARAASRTTPLYPSHLKRNAEKRVKVRKRSPADRYSNKSYGYAIRRACEKHGIPSWAPNQLRHSFGTDVRQAYGLEAAGASLGHSKMSVTEVYAERDAALALRVAAEAG